jgi:vacuolar protein-sorting-associated protein 4
MSANSKKNVYYERARVALATAIEYDEAKKRPEAVAMYVQACENSLLGLKQDSYTSSKVETVSRVKSWMERAEYLKAADKIEALPQVNKDGLAFGRSRHHPFDTVIGMDSAKQALRESVVLPFLQPQLFTKERQPWKGILLFGPPGTGKTLLASTVAEEAKCSFISVSSSDLVSKYVGDSEKSIRDLFQKARAIIRDSPTKRCVLFFDEIDSIGRSRDGVEKDSERRILTELLKQMDGVGHDNTGIVVIAATNLPNILDSALRRRFEKRIFVPLPGLSARAQILAKHLGPPGVDHQLSASDVVQIAKKTKGYSGADLASLSNEILLRPVRMCLNATHFAKTWDGSLVPCSKNVPSAIAVRMLDKNFDAKSLWVPLATWADAQTAYEKSKPSVSARDVDGLVQFAKQFGETIAPFEEEKVDSLALAKLIRQKWGKDATTYIGWISAKVSSACDDINMFMKRAPIAN